MKVTTLNENTFYFPVYTNYDLGEYDFFKSVYVTKSKY